MKNQSDPENRLNDDLLEVKQFAIGPLTFHVVCRKELSEKPLLIELNKVLPPNEVYEAVLTLGEALYYVDGCRQVEIVESGKNVKWSLLACDFFSTGAVWYLLPPTFSEKDVEIEPNGPLTFRFAILRDVAIAGNLPAELTELGGLL